MIALANWAVLMLLWVLGSLICLPILFVWFQVVDRLRARRKFTAQGRHRVGL